MTQPDPRIAPIETALKTRTVPSNPLTGAIGFGLSVAEILTITDEHDPARLALQQIRDWRISTFQQAEGVRIVVAYDDDADRESSFPVNTPMTIGEIIDDYNGTWPHIAIDAAEGAR